MEQWIISCNIKYYDVIGAFSKLDKLNWKQSMKNINIGDEIYIYVGAPIKAIKYRCIVTKSNLDRPEIDDSEFVIDGEVYEDYQRYMELELIDTYDDNEFPLKVLREYGLKGNIQGPRRAFDLINSIMVIPAGIFDDIQSLPITGDEMDVLAKARINQGKYRVFLIKRYKHCCLCGIENPSLLVASHIKPWSKCNGKEKTDVENGFLLCANHDKLFDQGLISFSDQGKIMISEELQKKERERVGIHTEMVIDITPSNKKYLDYHRKNIFVK